MSTDTSRSAQNLPETAKAGLGPERPALMPRCPACGQPEFIVWVHGHGQCRHCHMNVMPCCDGAVCDPS
jgi:hypothetical protein